MGAVELLGLPEHAGGQGALRRDHPDHAAGGPDRRLRTGHVGVQRRPQPVRDAGVAHAPALLDEQLHRLHRRCPLRVVGDDAVPLHQSGRAVGGAVGGGRRRDHRDPVRTTRRGSRGPASPAPRDQVLHGLLVRTVQDQADADPALSLVATTGPWHTVYGGSELATTWKIYEVHDASIVTPLTKTPDVLTATGPGQGSWLPVAQKWYADPARWSQQLVAGGPASWPRTATPSSPPAGRRLPAVHVTDVKVGIDSAQLPCRPDRGPRRRGGLVLPQLAGHGGQRSLAGRAQPDGGRPDLAQRHPDLRIDRGPTTPDWS